MLLYTLCSQCDIVGSNIHLYCAALCSKAKEDAYCHTALPIDNVNGPITAWNAADCRTYTIINAWNTALQTGTERLKWQCGSYSPLEGSTIVLPDPETATAEAEGTPEVYTVPVPVLEICKLLKSPAKAIVPALHNQQMHHDSLDMQKPSKLMWCLHQCNLC